MGGFTPLPTSKLSPGDWLDRYELLCVLAQGGMGTVWLARLRGKLGFGKLVALKTILPSLCEDRRFVDMFVDEAQIAAGIDHENVARLFEIGEDRGALFYAMELIDGESLRKLQRDLRAAGAPFPIPIALRIVADACSGLHAAHELIAQDGTPLEVVHRDVSPQNFLISVRGIVKLIDFGVAKARQRHTEETAVGTLKGKVEYMAPEQARGEAIDRRADIYALGSILYELLTGQPLRDTSDGNQLAALHEVMLCEPYAPLPSSIPQIIRAIVGRALASDPRDRPSSAEEMRLAIEEAMMATGLSATTDDVASLVGRVSAERTMRRRTAIDTAVKIADQRAHSAAHLRLPLIAQSSPATPSRLSGPPLTPAPYPYYPSPLPMPAEGAPTGPSIRTVGGSTLNTVPEQGSGTARMVAAGIVICLVALLGLIAGVLVTRRVDTPEVVTGGVAPARQPPAVTPTAEPARSSSVVVHADAAAPVVAKQQGPTAPAPTSVAPRTNRPQPPPPPPPPGKGPTRIGTVVDSDDVE